MRSRSNGETRESASHERAAVEDGERGEGQVVVAPRQSPSREKAQPLPGIEIVNAPRASSEVAPRESLSSRREWLVLLGWTLLAFLLRLVVLRRFEQVITPDGTEYVALGRSLMSGNFRGGLSVYWPPLYPLLVGLSTLFFRDPEFAGRFVSVLAGSLLVIPAHRLIRLWYGTRAALLGACLVALHPLLIYYSTALLTESTYTLFFTSGVLAGWHALSGGRARAHLLAGAAFGACYLLKPEAAGFLFLLLALVLCRALFVRTTRLKTTVRNALSLSAGFMSLAAPYLLYLRLETGSWIISGKLHKHLLQGGGSAANEMTPVGSAPAFGFTNAVVQIMKAMRFEYELFNLIFPPVFVLLVGLGLFRKRWTRERAWRELYLFTFIGAMLAGYAVTLPNIRFFVPLLPLLLCWLSQGIIEFKEWTNETLVRFTAAGRFWPAVRRLIVPLVVVGLLASLLPVFVYLMRGDKWGDYYGQKRAALWIREHDASPAPAIMATLPIAAFYAGGRHVPFVAEDYDAFINRARREGAGYVVVNERDFRHYRVRSLLNEHSIHPGLRRVHELEVSPGHKIVVYQLDETVTGAP